MKYLSEKTSTNAKLKILYYKMHKRNIRKLRAQTFNSFRMKLFNTYYNRSQFLLNAIYMTVKQQNIS